MVRKVNERFTQSVGNYEVIANTGISEKEELFIDTLNRTASLAYSINDMVRFFGTTLDRVEDEVTDNEWTDLVKQLNRINYQLNNCKNIIYDVYNELENR